MIVRILIYVIMCPNRVLEKTAITNGDTPHSVLDEFGSVEPRPSIFDLFYIDFVDLTILFHPQILLPRLPTPSRHIFFDPLIR